jgi:hypothetical protein
MESAVPMNDKKSDIASIEGLSSPEYSSRLRIEKKRLRLVALGCGLGFLVTVVMRVFQPF